jgi:nitrogen fixation NifU-like protein
MSELRELYQEMIIDHGRHPRNFGVLSDANYKKEGFNPLCGDKIIVYMNEKNGIIQELCFEGCGCAISMASASLMTEVLKGKSLKDVEQLFSAFHQLVTENKLSDILGKLTVLGGVSEFPARVKCAILAWHTLKAALANDSNAVSTE